MLPGIVCVLWHTDKFYWYFHGQCYRSSHTAATSMHGVLLLPVFITTRCRESSLMYETAAMSWIGTLRMMSSPSRQTSLMLYADKLTTASWSDVSWPANWWDFWKIGGGKHYISNSQSPNSDLDWTISQSCSSLQDHGIIWKHRWYCGNGQIKVQ